MKTSENKGFAKRAAALVGAVGSIAYLSNIGVGVVEFLPDNLPLVGNLDEMAFTFLLLYCSSYLGIPVPGLKGGTRGLTKRAR